LERSTGTNTGTKELADFQQALHRVPGVASARVVGDQAATEIHIVTDSDRNPKQLVRDVQSLAAATFGMRIDHRIVSVVRLEGPQVSTETGHRPYIEKIGVSSRFNVHWVEVSLHWPDGASTHGSGAAGSSRQTRARGAAVAVIECLDPLLSEAKSNVEIDQVEIHEIGGTEWVLTQATLYEGSSALPLLGSAQVHDDAASAAARAMLDAINRRLFRS
jgi:hypothetical protein